MRDRLRCGRCARKLKNYRDGVLARTVSDDFSIFSRRFCALVGRSRVPLLNLGLWINLPAAQKMSDPAYQEFAPERIPEVREPGRRVRVISGEYAGVHGPIDDPHTQVQYLDVSLDADATFQRTLPTALRAFVYVFEGKAQTQSKDLPLHSLAILSDGDEFTLTAGAQGARFILVAGRPLGEPIVQHGPFVMNTRAEIERAVDDFRNGRLVQKKASMRG